MGEPIGSWQIQDRNDREIVFGESLGFMGHPFSLRITKSADVVTIEASTVAQRPNVLARVYFAGVRLVHTSVVRKALLDAVRWLTPP